MVHLPKNKFVRYGLAVAAIALMSAFSYPLMSEGYRRMGDDAFLSAQAQLLEQSMTMYVAMRPDVKWNTETPTRQILTDLSVGLDRDLSGRPQSFIPASESVDSLAHNYRILYKGPNNFKVIAK